MNIDFRNCKCLATVIVLASGIHTGAVETSYVNSQPKEVKYPEKALAEGIEGTVLVSVWVGRDGLPSKAIARDGHKLLKMSAEVFVMKCRFNVDLIPNHNPSTPILVNVMFVLASKTTKILETA
ncbi:MAG: energy transducer TonB [Acidobacteria bacterium]|nr:energy transducer TonB [Acidobacteriota bacterium]MBI3487997.1 energy transducer TonB [Acidobacteriota bacterium]